MRPVRTPSTTSVLGAPKNWDEAEHGRCEGLPVVNDGKGCFASYWQPTLQDRIRILFGRKIRLTVVGYAHPPVMIDTEYP